MNKKGFTLIEVIAVITLMGVLVGIAAPAIYKIAGKHKTNIKTKQMNNILNIAGLYFQDNYDEYNECLESNNCKIELKDLKDSGYLDDDDLIDPNNNNKINNNINISETDDCSGKVVSIEDETYCLTFE